MGARPGPREWDPDGYWEDHWEQQFENTPQDPFGVELPGPDEGGWSMGVSQWLT